MSGHTDYFLDFFNDYLVLRKNIDRCRKIIKLSFIPLKITQAHGKFFVLGLILFIVLSSGISTFHPTGGLLSSFVSMLILFGFLQVLGRLYALITHEEDLSQVLDWIESLHMVPDISLIKDVSGYHLKRTMGVVKNISR